METRNSRLGSSIIHKKVSEMTPAYLTELCIPITQSMSSCRLRSSYCNRLAVPSVKLSIGSRSFSVSGRTVWNALPDYLRNPTLSIDVFKRYLKTFFYLLSINTTPQRIRNIVPLRYINPLIDCDWLIEMTPQQSYSRFSKNNNYCRPIRWTVTHCPIGQVKINESK